MKRSMLFIAILFAAGIMAWSTDESVGLLVIGIPIFAAFVFFVWNKRMAAAVLCVIIPFAGFFAMNYQYLKTAELSEPFYDKTAIVTCRVTNTYASGDYGYADVDCMTIAVDGEEYDVGMKARVRFSEGTKIIPGYGDIIRLTAEFYRPKGSRSRGGGSQRMSLLTKGIGLLTNANDVEIIGRDVELYRPIDLANQIRDNISSRLADDSTGILKALLIGDKSGMDKTVYEAFRKSGTAHVIAVSGMHLVSIFAFAAGIFSIFGIKKRWYSICICIAFIWMFSLVTGLGPSILRAALTTTIFYIAWFLRRDSDGINSLALAVIIMLVINPAIFFDVGFQLSVVSTLGILVLAVPLSERAAFLPKELGSILSVSLAAQIGTLPITAYHFGTVPVIGLVSNLIIVPVVTFSMFLGLAAVVVYPIPVIGPAVLFLQSLIVNGIRYTVLALGNAPFATAVVGMPSILQLICYGFILTALYKLLKGKTQAAAYASICTLFLIVGIMLSGVLSQNAELTFVEVGDGNCSVLKKQGITIMIDSGGSERYDVAGNYVIPFLEREGISKIDAAFLTHYHDDHGRAYVDLMKNGFIKRIILPEGVANLPLKRVLEDVAKETGTDVYYIQDRDVISAGGISITSYNTYDGSDENNGMVYYLRYGGNTVCFAGDVSKSGEETLTIQAPDLSCDILSVAHHGSNTSSSEGFIAAAMPETAVISCIKDPSEEVLATLEQYGAQTFLTGENGCITFTFNYEKIIKTEVGRGIDNEL